MARGKRRRAGRNLLRPKEKQSERKMCAMFCERGVNEVIRACRPGGLGEPDECFVLVLDALGHEF